MADNDSAVELGDPKSEKNRLVLGPPEYNLMKEKIINIKGICISAPISYI